jgi:hypothetical protein
LPEFQAQKSRCYPALVLQTSPAFTLEVVIQQPGGTWTGSKAPDRQAQPIEFPHGGNLRHLLNRKDSNALNFIIIQI